MKAEDLKLDELVSFAEGNLNLHGRRLVLHDMRAFAQFRKDLAETVGLTSARQMFTRFGYFSGEADAAAMKRIFEWKDPLEWIRAGARLHTLEGAVRCVIKVLEFDEASGRFLMDMVWHDSAEAEEHVAELGKSDEPACWVLAGYASGYASYCLGRPIYFIEQKCRAKGDLVCQAVGRDKASWGGQIEPYLKYFRADDIQGKIQKLTRDLRERTRELSLWRRQLGLGDQPLRGDFAEVRSPSFQRVLELARRVATFDSSVLITGESGVGKEVIARYVYRLSHRSKGPFVGVNCGALPETLLESELFGHKAGSFTGAVHDRVGLFEQATGGTIFLDEIGDVTPNVQVKLLRVLQEREVFRVGESKPRKVDVRVLAATNRNLGQAIAEGRFRDDLYYRLAVIEVHVPPLRERPEDILPLARLFVGRLAKKLRLPQLRLGAACLDLLQSYSWPGNVRELENALERAAVLSTDGQVLPEYLPSNILRSTYPRSAGIGSLRRTLAQVEQEHIQAVLEMTQGNRSRASRILGISPTTLWRKCREYGRGGEEMED
jgi:two-component system, NtrC family, response regulator HydG